MIVTDYGSAERELLDHLWDRGARQPALLSQSIEISFSRCSGLSFKETSADRTSNDNRHPQFWRGIQSRPGADWTRNPSEPCRC
jgi:hypothetical protein